MAVNSLMVELGTPAPDFALPSVTTNEIVKLDDFADAPALLVVFLCNHCPYVRYVESKFGEFGAEFGDRGLAIVGISSNDVTEYPDDAPDGMVEQIKRAGFTFPYLYDESQQVGQAYRAACTPDFFLYGGTRQLAYRGQFDGSRPNSTVPQTGESLRAAVQAVLAGLAAPEPQYPSLGCSIKYRPGNEPA